MTSLLPILLALSLRRPADSVVAHATRAIKPLTDSASLHNATEDLDNPQFLVYLPVNGALIPVGVELAEMLGD